MQVLLAILLFALCRDFCPSALKQKWEAWEQVLEKAECFQGIVREVKNPEMEKLATVITMEGSEHSLKNLQPIF